jgi:hypothetical protein
MVPGPYFSFTLAWVQVTSMQIPHCRYFNLLDSTYPPLYRNFHPIKTLVYSRIRGSWWPPFIRVSGEKILPQLTISVWWIIHCAFRIVRLPAIAGTGNVMRDRVGNLNPPKYSPVRIKFGKVYSILTCVDVLYPRYYNMHDAQWCKICAPYFDATRLCQLNCVDRPLY